MAAFNLYLLGGFSTFCPLADQPSTRFYAGLPATPAPAPSASPSAPAPSLRCWTSLSKYLARPTLPVAPCPSGTPAQLHDAAGIAKMWAAGQLAAAVLNHAGTLVHPGITTDDIDRAVHKMTIEAGTYPSPLNCGKSPESVCTSVNTCICYGIPDSRATAARAPSCRPRQRRGLRVLLCVECTSTFSSGLLRLPNHAT